ncbi:hypothetical protein Gotur_020017, partial [Gossypium turneri]
MGACVYPVNNIRDSTTVEVVACLQAVNFAKEIGFGDVVIEGDSLTVIKKLNYQEENRSVICNILNEIKLKVTRFRSLSFRYIPYSANMATYDLAVKRNGVYVEGMVETSFLNGKISVMPTRLLCSKAPPIISIRPWTVGKAGFRFIFGWTVCLPPVRLKTAVAVRLITVVVRLDTVAVRLETMVECVFGFKRSCSGE